MSESEKVEKQKGQTFSMYANCPHIQFDLTTTLIRYLNSILPFALTEPQTYNLSETQKRVIEFARSKEAEFLLQKIKEHEEKEIKSGRSILEDLWLKYAYLIWRDPVPISSNIGMCFDEEYLSGSQGQMPSQSLQAARLTFGLLQWKSKFWDKDAIPMETTRDLTGKTIPLCNWQYQKLFTTTRLPERECDKNLISKTNPFVTVISNSQIYFISPLNLTLSQLWTQFEWILQHSASYRDSIGFGVGTASNRDSWADLRHELEKMPANKLILDRIDSSLFVVSLDPATPSTVDQALTMILGGDARQRWFDKIFQIIVFGNGRAGLNGEHSPLDAVAEGVMVDWVLEQLKANQVQDFALVPQPVAEKPEAVRFVLANQDQVLRELWTQWDSYSSNLHLAVLNFTDYGGAWIKKQKLSPDAFVQMALQYNYYKMYGKVCATYETASTRQFFHGRTETTRSCSVASLRWVQGMISSQLSASEKIALLREAISAHTTYIVNAANGRGCDRHLLLMRIFSKEAVDNKQFSKMPDIFTDPVFSKSTSFQISTSCMPKCHYTPSFGPVVSDGYGMCYQPQDQLIRAGITSFKNCSSTNASKFRDSLIICFREMHHLFENSSKL